MVDRPFFRTDLVSQPIEDTGQRFVDVTDPDSGETFRFYEVEYAVACAMDGRRDLQGLVAWAREELGLEPSAEEVERVVSTLDGLGYLTDPFSGGEEVALGHAGRSSIPRASAAAAAPSGDEIDLGAPGRSPLEPQAEAPSTEDVPLGDAGRSPLSASAPTSGAEEPSEPAIELGLPGAGEEAASSGANGAAAAPPAHEPPPAEEPAKTPPAFEEDISLDLSQHLEIDRDDVKEAVRQSRAMAVPQVPADLEADLEAGEAPAAEAPPEPAPAPEPAAEPEPEAEKEPPVIPQKRAELKEAADKPAAEAEAKAKAKAATASPQPDKSSANVTLWVLIVFLLLLIGGLAYYYFFYLREGAGDRYGAKAQSSAQPAPPKKEAPPPSPEATLEAVFQEEVAASPADGKVAWLAEAGAEVEADEPVAKLRGAGAVEKEIAHLQKRLEHYQRKLDRATADGNKAKMRAAQRDVDRKKGDLEEAHAKLDKLVVAAPIAGTVEPMVELDADVKSGDELVRLTGHSGPEATFEIKDASAYEVGSPVTLASKKQSEITAECKIAESGGGKVKVSCPEHTGLESGTEVVLEGGNAGD